jgi:hypothetical protein
VRDGDWTECFLLSESEAALLAWLCCHPQWGRVCLICFPIRGGCAFQRVRILGSLAGHPKSATAHGSRPQHCCRHRRSFSGISQRLIAAHMWPQCSHVWDLGLLAVGTFLHLEILCSLLSFCLEALQNEAHMKR